MNTRIVKIDDLQFLICLKNELWGSNRNSFKKWKIDDRLIFSIDKKLTAVSKITDKPFYSESVVWDNNIFPYRIPINFEIVLDKNDRIPLSEVREILAESWGKSYGWAFQCQQPLKEKNANKLLDHERL